MSRTARPGYTLLELLVVLVLLLILAAAIVPTIPTYYGNVRQKAAADAVRTRLADARARAIEDGKPYRVAISQDRTRVRLAPDGPEFAALPADNPPASQSRVVEIALDQATAEVVTDASAATAPAVDGEWVTVATFLPDGTCREVSTTVAVRERDFQPILIHVRGVTGGSRVTTGEAKP